MIFTLLKLGRKESTRSRFRNRNLYINILLGFFILYFGASFAFIGFALPKILKEVGIEQDPVIFVNSFILVYLVTDLFMRFMIQSLPVLSIKHFLHLNIEKSSLINYLLIKSKFSAFNFIPLLFLIPFSFNIGEYNYSISQIVVWLIGMLLLLMVNNYLNFLLKRSFGDKSQYMLIALSTIVIFYALDYFEIFSIKNIFGEFLGIMMNNPILLLVIIALIAFLYYVNYKYLYSKLTLDDLVKNKTEMVAARSLSWADSFGDIAPYIKLDVRMIMRNKRPKSVVYMSFAMLFYGLIFYTNPIYKDEMPVFLIFVAVFITGIFSINFGQFIPAWDSGHYSMLMTQRTNLLIYVKSKYMIMAFSVTLFFILSTPYVYFGWDILLLHLVGALYNIGANNLILLMFASYNNKPIDLSRSSMMNYQGTGAKQWLLVIPILALPVLIFWLGSTFYGFYGGVAILAAIGVAGIIFHQKLIYIVAQQLADRKHLIIESFKEKS